MKGTVIVVGGEIEERLQLWKDFERELFNFIQCNSYEEFATTAQREGIVAVLLFYPDDTGIIQELHSENAILDIMRTVPVVFISSSAEHNNRARSLNFKADEFLIEPINFDELVNIIDNAPRTPSASDIPQVLVIGDLTLDRVSLTASLRNSKLPLHPIDLRVLAFLMSNAGHAFTRRAITRGIWGTDNSIDGRTIDVAILRIRNTLRHKVTINPIRTIRGVGYAFNERFGERPSLPKRKHLSKRDL